MIPSAPLAAAPHGAGRNIPPAERGRPPTRLLTCQCHPPWSPRPQLGKGNLERSSHRELDSVEGGDGLQANFSAPAPLPAQESCRCDMVSTPAQTRKRRWKRAATESLQIKTPAKRTVVRERERRTLDKNQWPRPNRSAGPPIGGRCLAPLLTASNAPSTGKDHRQTAHRQHHVRRLGHVRSLGRAGVPEIGRPQSIVSGAYRAVTVEVG